MSFDFGFAKEKYSNDVSWKDRVYYFSWCGRENYKLFTMLSLLGESVLVDTEGEYLKYYEYKIDIKKLNFISKLYKQVHQNKYYEKILKLCMFNDDFVNDYVNSLSMEDKADLRLAFILDNASPIVDDICIELFDKFECGYYMIDALYDGYMKMIEDGVDTVWLYGD